MKGMNWVKFLLVVAVIGVLTYLAIYGLDLDSETRIKSVKEINFGIDIRGGVEARFYAILKPGQKLKSEDLETAKAVIGKRLDSQGITDRSITTNPAGRYIFVQIPAKKGVDPKSALKIVGTTAHLTFRQVAEKDTTADKEGNYRFTGDEKAKPNDKDNPVLVDGIEVADAFPQPNPNNSSESVVSLKLKAKGKEQFAAATKKFLKKPIAIYLDDRLLVAPTVESVIDSGEAMISGQGQEEAKVLAELIKAGALPFSLEQKQENQISPTLGQSALDVSIKSGFVAFILVCLFMLFYYRLPGIMANIALFGHTVIQLCAISWMGLTLTLPGIAGIILTIGMGVDANVIIYERIKEELKLGKTLRAAIDIGFKRAFKAILDANVTTLISAVVLGFFGTGTMVSFAYTLGLGVLLSFLTAITASRVMLTAVAGVNLAKHPWLYGVSVKSIATKVGKGAKA